MTTPRRRLVIDARPRGPRGAFAVERLGSGGQSVIDHLISVVHDVSGQSGPVPVLAEPEVRAEFADRHGPTIDFVETLPSDALVLRTDRLYDAARVRSLLRRGGDVESAVFWRLDRPHGIEGAADELARRRSFQPLGKYWALGPARLLARRLAPTSVRPNAVTLAASGIFLGSAGVVGFAPANFATQAAAAVGLAVALVLDTSDGHLARLQGTASPFGRWLDGWLDEVGDMALHAAVAWSAYTRTGHAGWLVAGMLYAMGKYIFVAGNSGWDEPASGEERPAGPIPESRATAAARLIGHADVRWHLWILLAALGRLDVALIAYAAYFPARAVLGAARKGARRG